MLDYPRVTDTTVLGSLGTWIRSQVLEIPRPELGTPTNPFFVILDTAFSATVRDMLSTRIHLSLCVALVRSDDI